MSASNFQVNPGLKAAVEAFVFNEQPVKDELSTAENVNVVVDQVLKSIKASADIRQNASNSIGRELSLVEVSYLSVQNNSSISTTIQNVTEIEKKLLSHSYKMLSDGLKHIEKNDIKQMTLLFGMMKVHEIASGVIKPVSPQIAEMEATLNNLKAMRSRFPVDISGFDEASQAMLTNVDAKIQEMTDKIEELRAVAH